MIDAVGKKTSAASPAGGKRERKWSPTCLSALAREQTHTHTRAVQDETARTALLEGGLFFHFPILAKGCRIFTVRLNTVRSEHTRLCLRFLSSAGEVVMGVVGEGGGAFLIRPKERTSPPHTVLKPQGVLL